MIKAISTVIASVLMLMIVTALAGTAYLYISGTFTSKTATTFAIVDSINNSVIIRHTGSAPITRITATLDNNPVNIAVVPNIQGIVGYWSFNEGSFTTVNSNPSFESDLLSWINQGSFTATIDNIAKDGGKSLKIVQSDSDGGGFVVSSDFIPVTPGERVRIRAWIKGDITYQSQAWCNGQVSSHLYDTNKNIIQNWFLDVGGTPSGNTDWGEYSSENTVPFNGRYIRPQAGFDCGGDYVRGTVWFDNVRLEKPKATDSSGKGNDGTLINFDYTASSGWVDGKYGKALQFDGSNDYVDITNPSSSLLNLGNNFAIEGWLRIPTTSSRYTILSNGIVHPSHDWNGFLTQINVCSPTEFNLGNRLDTLGLLGKWFHYVITYSKSGATGTVKLYVNGDFKNQVSRTCSDMTSGTYARIGWQYSNWNYFAESMDDFRIYNRVISPEEISTLSSGLVSPGQLATIKPLATLTKGTHTLRLCTSSMCNTAYLTIQ